MKNKILSIMLLVLIVIFSGCGAAKSDSPARESKSAPMQKAETSAANGRTQSSSDGAATAADNTTAPDSTTALTGTGESSKLVDNPILNERKIIRNANVSVEVEDFDKAYGKLEFMIAGIGYVQETKINKEKHYISDKEVLKTRGTIIIRVDAEKFGDVLKDVKGLGLLLEENIKSDDVTDKFFDIESRLRLIKYEESRLEEYLKKITEPDTIFKTEARLTDIRHEIESLTGNLNKLGNLVKLSTITINMSEEIPSAEKLTKEKSYWNKLASGFTGSLKGVVRFCGEFVIVVVTAFPALVLITIISFSAFVIYKKFVKKLTRFNTQKDKDIGNS